MNRRVARGVVAVVVVLGLAVGAVRIADPFRGPAEPRPLDLDAPPAELAAAALERAGTADYTVERRRRGEGRRVTTTYRVSASQRRYHARTTYHPVFPSGAVTFSDAVGAWRRPRAAGPLTPLGWHFLTLAPGWNRGLFYHDPSRLADAAVAVVAENASALVLRVEGTDAAMAVATGEPNATSRERWADRDLRASYTVVVDRERRVLRRTVFRRSARPEGTADAARETDVLVHNYRDWGATRVERPPWVPHSFETLLADLLDRCYACSDGDPT